MESQPLEGWRTWRVTLEWRKCIHNVSGLRHSRSPPGLTGLRLNGWSVFDRVHISVSVFTAPTTTGPGSRPLASAGLCSNTLRPCFQSEFSGPDRIHISSQQPATHMILSVKGNCHHIFLLEFWQSTLPGECINTDLTEVRVPSVQIAGFTQTIRNEPRSPEHQGSLWLLRRDILAGMQHCFPRRGSFTRLVMEMGLWRQDEECVGTVEVSRGSRKIWQPYLIERFKKRGDVIVMIWNYFFEIRKIRTSVSLTLTFHSTPTASWTVPFGFSDVIQIEIIPNWGHPPWNWLFFLILSARPHL